MTMEKIMAIAGSELYITYFHKTEQVSQNSSTQLTCPEIHKAWIYLLNLKCVSRKNGLWRDQGYSTHAFWQIPQSLDKRKNYEFMNEWKSKSQSGTSGGLWCLVRKTMKCLYRLGKVLPQTYMW